MWLHSAKKRKHKRTQRERKYHAASDVMCFGTRKSMLASADKNYLAEQVSDHARERECRMYLRGTHLTCHT